MTIPHEQLVIIGTGDYARALGHRLLEHGYSLVYGSRLPKKRDLTAIAPVFKANTKVKSIKACIEASHVIFHMLAYVYLIFNYRFILEWPAILNSSAL